MIKEKKLLSFPSMRKQYFVAKNLLGEWGSMQMTVMSDGLLLNSKFEPKPNLSKTLKGLLMRLVIFENTIFQLNLLNITTVSVCYVSGSKVNRKERTRPSLLFFVPPCWIYHHLGAFGSVLSEVRNGHRKSVWISMITGITTAPPIKVVVSHTHVSKPFE